MQGPSLNEITVVVCAKNCAVLMDGCLGQIKKVSPLSELIVVDGLSTDDTILISKKYADKVISDSGKGLATARQLGIDNAKGKYVAFIGPDNKVSAELLSEMAYALESNPETAAVFPKTEFVSEKTYWEKTSKYIYKFLINKVGKVDVVGTPCMYPTKIVKEIRYDSSFTGGCDDTDLSLRLQKAGYSLQMIDSINHEVNSLDFKSFYGRWKSLYGKGDAEFYSKYKNSWTLKRKILSLTHPFRKYIVKGSWQFLKHGKIIYIPGLILGAMGRYIGWYQYAKKLKQKNI